MLYDVLVVGAGPAGITAAIYAKRANLKVAMFSQFDHQVCLFQT